MRRYWGTSPIGSRRTKPPINTPDAGVTGAGGSGGRGRASRSTTPSLPPLVWRSHGRPGPTVPRKPAAPQVPTRRSNGGRAERRPTQREGRCTRYGARHPIRRGALPTDRVQRTQSQEQTRNLRDDRRHAQGPGSSRSRGLSTQRSANAPRRAVAAVRDGDAGGGQAVAQLVGARPVLGGAGSSPLGQHGPDQRVQRRVLGGGRTRRTRTDADLAARARQYTDRDSPATRPYKTLRISLTNQVADSLVPARRA